LASTATAATPIDLRSSRGSETPGLKDQTTGLEHILASNKRLAPGKFADVPYNWERCFKLIGMEKIQRSKKSFYPVVRHNFSLAPDAVLHYLERALHPDEYVGNENETVATTRKNLAAETKTIAQQSLYALSEKQANDVLLGGGPLEPELWVDLLSHHYQADIFLYEIDENDANGNVVLPASTVAYLSCRRSAKTSSTSLRPSVLLFLYRYQSEGRRSTQIDVACRINLGQTKKIESLSYVFGGEDDQVGNEITSKAREMFNQANQVLVVSAQGYEKYC
jgi:hypothetical protein